MPVRSWLLFLGGGLVLVGAFMALIGWWAQGQAPAVLWTGVGLVALACVAFAFGRRHR
jgi:hypothetical protein